MTKKALGMITNLTKCVEIITGGQQKIMFFNIFLNYFNSHNLCTLNSNAKYVPRRISGHKICIAKEFDGTSASKYIYIKNPTICAVLFLLINTCFLTEGF